jgi:shikimate kinase
MSNNITLIGMPGAGKSSVGLLLAASQHLTFIDTDNIICEQQGRSLQNIVDEDGYMQLRRFEKQAILSIEAEHSIISTGGSTVYSSGAMQHLSAMSQVIYLQVPFDVIQQRIKNLDTRGLAKKPEQSLHDLYLERAALYEMYADITVSAETDVETVAEAVAKEIAAG